MKRLVLVSAAAGLLLTGCSGTGGTVTATGGGQGSGSASPSPADASSSAANPTFGQTYSYDDGLKVTVSRPKKVTPSDSAVATRQWPAYVSFTVTLTNGTKQNYDPTLFTTSLQSGTTEGGQVFDSAQGIEGAPTTPLLPGRQLRFSLGYGVQDPSDLVLQVTPGFDRQPVIFTS